MPLFLLPRKFDPNLSDEEKEFSLIQMISAGTWFPEVRWQRSYFVDEPDRLQTWCLYEGPSQAEVIRHTLHCGAPYEEAIAVEEWLPGSETGLLSRDISAASTPAREDDHYYLVERTFADGTEPDEIGAAFMRSGQCAAELPRLYWVRTFWSEERTKSWCVFRAPDRDLIAQHSERSIIPCDLIETVGENHPSLWGHIYDMLGLERHWGPAAPTAAQAR